MRKYAALFLLYFVAACALMGTTPESQLQNGARTFTSGVNLLSSSFERGKITKEQAQNYRAMLSSTNATLDTSLKALKECRAKTGSTQKTSPDPCAQTVAADVNLSLGILTQIESTLKEKQ